MPRTPAPTRISRRTLLKATTATAGVLATAAALGELETPAHAAAGFVKGVDIGWVPQMEARRASSGAGWTGPPPPGPRWSPAPRR
uniref:hypothetical protein n=1 Tax=Streptomyces hawaiiensis TaxID=67305 RepID=UPI0031DAFF04